MYFTCLYFLYLCTMNNPNIKEIHKIQLYFLKIIPMLLALISFIHILLSYIGIDTSLLSYLGGTSVIPLTFLYISSYAFKFCLYHRMFLHYISINWILNMIDCYIGIPISNKLMLMVYLLITCICMFIILYLKKGCNIIGKIKR